MWQILQGHSDEVWFLQFSHNGKYLASSSKDQSAMIWEVTCCLLPLTTDYENILSLLIFIVWVHVSYLSYNLKFSLELVVLHVCTWAFLLIVLMCMICPVFCSFKVLLLPRGISIDPVLIQVLVSIQWWSARLSLLFALYFFCLIFLSEAPKQYMRFSYILHKDAFI